MDVLILIGGIFAAYIITLAVIIHNAPTMKDLEDIDKEDEHKI